MTELLVVDSAADLAGEAGGGPVLTLGDVPVLTTAEGTTEVLDAAERGSLRRVAAAVSEVPTPAALTVAGGDAELDGAMIASGAKLDSLLTGARFLLALAALRRVAAATTPISIRWLTHDQALARAVLERLLEGSATGGAGGAMVISPPTGMLGSASERALRSLKRRRLDWSTRHVATLPAALGAAARLERRVSGARRANPVVAVFDVRNSGMIANLAAVVNELETRGVPCLCVYMEPRVGDGLAHGHPHLEAVPLAAYATGGRVARSVLDASRTRLAMGDRWRSAPGDAASDGSARPLVADAAANAGDLLAPGDVRRLEDLIASLVTLPYVAQGLVDLAAWRRLFSRLEPRAVITSSDAHRYSRLAVLHARREGVRSLVLQHGALVGDHVYVPVIADVMAAWGPWCRQWFVTRGVPAERVLATGYPRGRDRSSGPMGEPGGARDDVTALLFAAQPIQDDVSRELLHRVFTLMSGDASVRVTLRPHPGESRRSWLESLVRAAPAGVTGRVELSPPGSSLSTDLEHASAVLTTESTVGIDALNAGVPLVLLTHPRLRRAIPFAEFGAALPGADAAELAGSLRDLGSAAVLARLDEGRERFLTQYVGPVGSAAAAAVAEAVLAAEWPS